MLTKYNDFEIFIPFWSTQLSLFKSKKKDKIVKKYGLLSKKVVEIFEYKKNNDGYWDSAKSHHQMMKKALFILKALYPRLFFFFFW